MGCLASRVEGAKTDKKGSSLSFHAILDKVVPPRLSIP
jgi:hypothetical protein